MAKKSTPEVQIIRDWTRPDPLAVENRDPAKSYRWVDKSRLEQKKYDGWMPVRDEEVIHRNPDGDPDSSTKQYRELILCEMPREKANARNRFFLEKAKRAAEAARVRFHRQGQKLGIQTEG